MVSLVSHLNVSTDMRERCCFETVDWGGRLKPPLTLASMAEQWVKTNS